MLHCFLASSFIVPPAMNNIKHFLHSATIFFISTDHSGQSTREDIPIKMFTSRRNKSSSVASSVYFAAILFCILVASSLFCSFSLYSIVLDSKSASQPDKKVHLDIVVNSVLSVQEELKETHVKHEDSRVSVAPVNATEKERIAWFRKQLPRLEIFKRNAAAEKFGERARAFFESGCEIQVFMTWISPVTSFGHREMLSVESVFKAHPNGCLMILSNTMDSKCGDEILKPLVQNGFRVLAATPDLPFLFKGTPAEAWFEKMKKGDKDPGEIPLAQNLSNLLRLAVLYKYGGVYLDTDFIVIKKLSGLRNTIGAQSIDLESRNWTRLNNAVLVFDKNHPLLYKFIEEFALTFDGNKWGHNGPYLVSRVVQRLKHRPGYAFTVLPPMAFYPVYWNKITGFFKKPNDVAESRWVAAKLLQMSGETYGVHLWNKQSSRLRIEEGSIMEHLISRNCIFCEHISSS